MAMAYTPPPRRTASAVSGWSTPPISARAQRLPDPCSRLSADASVRLSATGLGKVTPEWPTGLPARVDNPPAVVANIRAFVNGAPVPVTRATLAGGFIGFYVIELQLPAINNSGPAELYITADGVESNRVQFVIE